jgi:hypothetical protein
MHYLYSVRKKSYGNIWSIGRIIIYSDDVSAMTQNLYIRCVMICMSVHIYIYIYIMSTVNIVRICQRSIVSTIKQDGPLKKIGDSSTTDGY